jgi:DNA-binding MarR family transcriptional regulator
LTDYQLIAEFRTALRHFLSETDFLAARHGLTAARYDLLVMIKAAGDEGIMISVLAERLSLAPNSVTELVDRAERAGLVARRPDEGDARATRVLVTAEGDARIAAAVGALDAQRRHLLDLLAHVRQRLDAR